MSGRPLVSEPALRNVMKRSRSVFLLERAGSPDPLEYIVYQVITRRLDFDLGSYGICPPPRTPPRSRVCVERRADNARPSEVELTMLATGGLLPEHVAVEPKNKIIV